MIKNSHQLHRILARFFNFNIYPDSWRLGYIISMYKKGSPTDTNNYRGITINNVISKFFSIILNNRLQKYIEPQIKSNQIGFKKNHRTLDHIFVLKTLIDKYVKQNGKFYVCFVDFEKAFDKVWRLGLLFKMRSIGIKGKFYEIIKNIYTNTSACIKSNFNLSESFTTDLGVKQGEPMSPILFNIYLNDLSDKIAGIDNNSPNMNGTSVNSLLYADDLTLLSTSSNGLQNKLDKLKSYCDDWKLTLNISKRKVIEFNRTGRQSKYAFHFMKTTL